MALRTISVVVSMMTSAWPGVPLGADADADADAQGVDTLVNQGPDADIGWRVDVDDDPASMSRRTSHRSIL